MQKRHEKECKQTDGACEKEQKQNSRGIKKKYASQRSVIIWIWGKSGAEQSNPNEL